MNCKQSAGSAGARGRTALHLQANDSVATALVCNRLGRQQGTPSVENYHHSLWGDIRKRGGNRSYAFLEQLIDLVSYTHNGMYLMLTH